MTEGAIAPKLLALSWPLVAGNLLQTLYNLADVFWVGRVGADAVAAVSLMFPTSWMFVSTAMGITASTIALVSQHIGAGEDRQADHVVGQTILLTLAVSIVLAVVGFAFRHPLLSLIGAQGPVFTKALAYIEVVFLSLPLTFLFFAFRAALQGAGDTKTAMWLMVASAGLNVLLDPILILGWGPIPGMGTRGAAIATLIARLFATAAGVYILLRGDWGVQLHLADLRPDPERLQRLVDIGYPATLDGWARSFSAVVMAGFVARFGPIATAAYGIGVRLMSVSWTVSGAVGQATATGVGQNLGAQTPKRAASVTWTAMIATMGILFAAGGLVMAFPAEAMRLFIGEQAVVDEGVTFLRMVAPSWAFFGGVMVIQGAFRGAGITKAAMVLSFLSRWIFRVPVALVLAFAWTVSVPGIGPVSGLTWGVEGLWWAYVFGAVASFVVAVAWFRTGSWRKGVLDRGPSAAAGDD
ncbi:MATE family efflux transporter [Haloferax mediterranei ATCC 33500]|nr:MATE family efflux transporter [Haloferax mediterranei]EMA02357.1 MATE efflux family protein [Haloferax mediterranei ATCC 33500]MDX5988460.1 MATE family efflux transporter [Haloferax mediterranei ATCC 33500]QCQ74880.1 MATE family efflux transporter [Haloferax mediterranei ATCC 33500]